MGTGLIGILEAADVLQPSPTGAAAAVSAPGRTLCAAALCGSGAAGRCKGAAPLEVVAHRAGFPARAPSRPRVSRPPILPARTPPALALAPQSGVWAFLAFLLWTCTFGTNLALSLLLLMVTVLLGLEAACPSHPHLYRVGGLRQGCRRLAAGCGRGCWERGTAGVLCLPASTCRSPSCYRAPCTPPPCPRQATGIFGIATAALAFYLGAASLYIDMYGRVRWAAAACKSALAWGGCG